MSGEGAGAGDDTGTGSRSPGPDGSRTTGAGRGGRAAPRAWLAAASEWRQLGRLLGRSFQDDPMWVWMAPDPARRVHLGALFAQLVRRRAAEGTLWTTEDRTGAAAWAPPGAWKTNHLENLRMAVPMMRTVGLPLLRDRLTALARIEKLHPSEPHWYLEIVGAEPDLRGRGIGTAVITPVLEHCDAEGVGAYLESSSPANVPLYARLGFVQTDEVPLAPGAPPVFPMWRDPR